MKRNTEQTKKRPKLKLKKNDIVRVISGEYRGSEGKILSVDPLAMRVVVDGVNIRKRHMRPTQENPEGQIIEREMPIHYSNVMLLDDAGRTTRIAIERSQDEDGRAMRIARTTGNEI